MHKFKQKTTKKKTKKKPTKNLAKKQHGNLRQYFFKFCFSDFNIKMLSLE